MAKTPRPVDKLAYEEALSEFEQILTTLEGESRELEETLRLFERGKELLNHCQELLENAELRVRQITTEEEIVDLEEQA